LAPAEAAPPARSKQTRAGSIPWPNWCRLARMRLMGPSLGTPESSSLPAASLAKSTSAANGVTSPRRSESACMRSRHQAAWTAAPTAASPIVTPAPYWLTSGCGSAKRGPTLKIALFDGATPPGRVAVASLPAFR
jgi:hypothetical protein